MFVREEISKQNKSSHHVESLTSNATKINTAKEEEKSALARVLARLTLDIAEHIRPDEGEDDDGHWQGVVSQGLALVCIEVRPEGEPHRSD